MRAPAISIDQLASLPEVYRAIIPPAYEDRNGHMNMRWYLALYDEDMKLWCLARQVRLVTEAKRRFGSAGPKAKH